MRRNNRQPRCSILLATVVVSSVLAVAATGAVQVERPTYEVAPDSCITADCHGEVKDYPVLHGPVNINTCDACHQPTSAQAHTFALAREKTELCTYCHEFDTGMLPVVHTPVILGECLGCHNPHGGVSRDLVREDTMAQLCGRCHESVAFGKPFLHDPVKTGDCTACHRPHAAKYPKLLDAVESELCLSCHQTFASQMQAVQFTHEALDEGCSRCHDAHGSAYPMEVTQALPDLCLDCHDTIKDDTTAVYRHPAVLGERACLTCHTAHGSDLARLMSDLPVRICMTCHDEEIEMASGGVVAAVAEINDPNLFKHSPIRDGQCGGCHSTHGGDKPLLLRGTVSKEFYQRFSADKYDLCFSCHDERLAKQEQAQGLTHFRNGNRNLHFVHIEQGNRGRGCSVCHSTHASQGDQLIRARVPYGEWQLPITFTKTSTGGNCETGCHQQFPYDRVNPVPSPSLGLALSSRVPRADQETPVVVTWSVQDIEGSGVAVPAEQRPSVLLFLRAEQVQSHQVIKMVSAVTPDIHQTQVLVILSGPQAQQQARAVKTKEAFAWPVIADTEYALSKPLGVDVWPSTLVVREDGVLVTYLGGAPLSLSVQLRAYLDLATGKIDRETLNQRLARQDLVGFGPEQRAAWHLQMGRRLLSEGKPEAARAMLVDGLAFQPDGIPLKVEMIRALADLNEAVEVLDLLRELPQDAIPSWERDLLGGRMLAFLGHWQEARYLAVTVLEQKPNLSDAHTLMGMVYQHEEDWEKAAQEYRAALAGKDSGILDQ